jgi:peptide/nickel transport system substrate-binding protein
MTGPVFAVVDRIGYPRLDSVIAESEPDPDISHARFMAGDFDYQPDLIRADLRLELEAAGHTTMGTPGFHVCYSGINCRDYVPDDYGQPDAGRPLYPLNLSSFRLMMAWAGFSMAEKEANIVDIYGSGTVIASSTIIPEALGVWHNPAVPKPGGNFTKAWEILQADGFTVVAGELIAPNGDPVRDIEVLSPIEAPTSVEFSRRFVVRWNEFMDTFLGVTNCEFLHVPINFGPEVVRAFDYRNHDVYWLCWGLSRFPDFIYDFFHSDTDIPGADNSPGLTDPELDGYIETVKWGIDYPEKLQAAHDAQQRLYELSPYIYFYHRIYWEALAAKGPAHANTLMNAIQQAGYGGDNAWTWALMHWNNSKTGGNVNYVWGAPPDDLHPGWADSAYEAWLITRVSEGLTAVTPDLRDIPFIATAWEVETFSWAPLGIDLGTKITFRIRNDLHWNDGFPITAEDVKFSWEFMTNFPQLFSVYQYLLWVEIIDPQTVTAYLDTTSQYIVWDFSGVGLYFPQHIYDPAMHPTRDPVNDEVFAIDWDDWMADYTGTIPAGAGFPYSALVNAGTFDFVSYDETLEIAELVKRTTKNDFFQDSPIEGAINIAGRVGAMVGGVYDGTDEYLVDIINVGSKDTITGELTPCVIGQYVVYIDDVVDTAQAVSYSLEPFDYVDFGPHPVDLAPGVHNFTVVIYEEGVADPIDVTTQFIIATAKEDMNLDIFIGVDDIVAAAEAFGAAPPPSPG